MNKIASIIIALGLVVVIIIIFQSNNSKINNTDNSDSISNVEVRDNVQYITIKASGGYFPNQTDAQAGLPTKLIIKTGGTFDCSAALVIRELNFQEILPQTGATEIDLGTPQIGRKPLQGTCSMGMYNFTINFI